MVGTLNADSDRGRTTWEAGGRALLSALANRVLQGLREVVGQPANARLCRLHLHIRGTAGSEALVVLDLQDGVEQPSLGLGATAWSALQLAAGPISVDVATGRVWVVSSGRALERLPRQRLSAASRALYADRAATHILILPVWDASGAVAGLLGVEVSCPAAAGDALELWPQVVAPLTERLNAAAPALLDELRRRPSAPVDSLLPIVGPALEPIVGLLRRFSRFEDPVLLLGESGVGKTRLAEWVHRCSPRVSGPFVSVQLHAVPADLLEGALFGSKRGAYTGADRPVQGYVAHAEGGTLFLDEIDRLDLAGQDKLLRLLDDHRYRPLGESSLQEADVRFILASNADLPAAVAAGKFRSDLYWRIEGLRVTVPPLRERVEEIDAWARHFLAELHAEAGGRGGFSLSPAAAGWLRAQPWLGNLRELRQRVRRAYILSATEGEPMVRLELEAFGATRAPLAPPSGLVAALQQAAVAWVDHAERNRNLGAPSMDLDEAKVLRAYILDEARGRMGLEEAFRLLGEHALVESRNHHQTARREAARRVEFEAHLRDRG